ncbi:hypothetical protein AB60_5108 [Escherichia coli 2-156-04_S1_C3]|nr:hypothetical protein AB60_5108 [Escherichia coli 2-156-04_S1_C3]
MSTQRHILYRCNHKQNHYHSKHLFALLFLQILRLEGE